MKEYKTSKESEMCVCAVSGWGGKNWREVDKIDEKLVKFGEKLIKIGKNWRELHVVPIFMVETFISH